MIRRMKTIQMQQLTRERLPRFQFGHTKKGKFKNIEKRKNPKKQKKEKQKNRKKKNPKKKKKKKKKGKKKKKNLFSVVLDKRSVFCLYPILDSQQYVQRGSYRRQILSGLLCLFSFWALDPFVTSFEFGPRTLSVFTLSSI